MRNEVHNLLAAYYECLSGLGNVYQGAVPGDERSDYYLIRAEGENDVSNKTYFATTAVVIIESVSFHTGIIDTSKVEVMDNAVRQLIFPTRRTNGIGNLEDAQVVNVRLTDAFYDEEFDGQRYKHRKICRYENRINQHQLNNS